MDPRPRVARPLFRLAIDGENITQRLEDRLESLTLTDNRGFEADQLDLTLLDHDGRLALPRRGVKLSLSLGWSDSGLVDKGTYLVDEVEHSGSPDKLTLRARSADLRAGLTTQREHSYHRQTVGTIVRTIAARNQLQPVLGEGLADEQIEHLDQTNESDANLLTRLAQQCDAIATVKADRLLFCRAGQAATATGDPLPTVTITRASGDSHRFTFADRDAYSAVTAYYHDGKAARKRAITVNGKGPTSGKDTDPSSDSVRVLRHTYATKATATRAAKAEWERLQRGVAQFALTLAQGRPDLFPETPVTVAGFKPEIDGEGWLVVRVVHTLGGGGFTTALELELQPAPVM
ncbi:phage late control D family protein [Chitiniphilus shinanonensis]|uniref:phage late control D family protein n=1 Tax=Chitiniphilus shinanonensis TaxID=553088 RepID=UPI00305870E9